MLIASKETPSLNMDTNFPDFDSQLVYTISHKVIFTFSFVTYKDFLSEHKTIFKFQDAEEISKEIPSSDAVNIETQSENCK